MKSLLETKVVKGGVNRPLGKILGNMGISDKDAQELTKEVLNGCSRGRAHKTKKGLKYDVNEIRLNKIILGTLKIIEATDQIFKGMIFAGKDFNAALGTGKLMIQGAVVAYGGDPDDQTNIYEGSGNINIQAGNVSFIYDPTYLGVLQGIGGFNFENVFWATFDD